MRNRTKALTEGAMMCAFFAVLLILNRQSAQSLEFLGSWMLSFPIIIYTEKYTLRQALIPAFSMLFLSFIFGVPTTIFYVFSAICVGLFYGSTIEKWKRSKCLFVLFLIHTICSIITMVIFAELFGYDPSEDIIISQIFMKIFSIPSIYQSHIVIFVSITFSILYAILQSVCIHIGSIVLFRRLGICKLEIKNWKQLQWYKHCVLLTGCIWMSIFIINVIKLNGIYLLYLYLFYSILCIVMTYGNLLWSITYSISRNKKWMILPYLVFCIVAILYPMGRFILLMTSIVHIILNKK